VGRTLCSQGKHFLNRHSLGHLLGEDAVLWDARCVLKGIIFQIDTPWGHLFRADAVLWDVRCVLMGSVFSIDTPWGISSGRTLCCGKYAVYSREVF
jgi:hypothetical protein